MAKHVQEGSFYGRQGFSAATINGAYTEVLAPENTMGVLNVIEGYGISLTFSDNSLVIAQSQPSWTTAEW